MAQRAMEDLRDEMGGLRPAEAMVRYARPLLRMAQDEKGLQTFMHLAQTCWNLALMPPDERQQALEETLKNLNVDELGRAFQRELLKIMIKRHEELFPLMHRTRGAVGYALTPDEEVRRLMTWGWEYLSGEIDPAKAKQHFEKALELDPQLAEAHNGLAEAARLRFDYKRAEAHHKKALEKAKANLGTDDPAAHEWGKDPKTRPYLDARRSLGLLYEELRRYDAAITEYRAIAERDPLNVLGIWYSLAPAYQLKGDLAGAMHAYEEFERNFPDDPGDPFYRFNWGLALFASGNRKAAVVKLRSALFLNHEIAPVLLSKQDNPEDLEEEMVDTELEEAWEYEDLYAQLWDETPGALDFLDRLWQDPETLADFEAVLELQAEMDEINPLSDEGKWDALDKQLQAIEEREPSPELLRRVLGEAPA
jgi:tetratricopeptide (TPR) repeat protein